MVRYDTESDTQTTQIPWENDEDSLFDETDLRQSYEAGVPPPHDQSKLLTSNVEVRSVGTSKPLTGVWLFITVLISSAIVIAFESFIFAKFQSSVDNVGGGNESLAELRTTPTYLALFLFAAIFQLVMTTDSLYAQNTVEIWGLCIFELAMAIYGAIQYSQIRTAVIHLSTIGIYNLDSWPVVKAFLIAVPCVLGVATFTMTYLAYKLYRELGWAIYKYIGADRRLHSHYLRYLIFITLLKFDFFFFVGFTVQFTVVVLHVKDVEFALTLAMVPITIIFLVFTYWTVRRESKLGMVMVFVGLACGLAYFVFKLVRIYTPVSAYKYLAVRKSLTGFAVVTIVLLLATAVNAALCIHGFGRGLKKVFKPVKNEESFSPIEHEDLSSRPSNRMTIE